jgi:hypothetical protein
MGSFHSWCEFLLIESQRERIYNGKMSGVHGCTNQVLYQNPGVTGYYRQGTRGKIPLPRVTDTGTKNRRGAQ